jgi:mRNA-degrading endonuclease RelE of RelBE toxin-antitoxin system
MAFDIVITDDAEAQMNALSARQQRILDAAILAKLQHDPATPTRAIKRLRPNPLAEFELRVGDLRVLYNIEGTQVVLLVIGRKEGNKLIVAGEEFHEHRDDSIEPTGEQRSPDT